ncbi:uncharacterized protein LOC130800981 [Amaranthus tricolor]|uniref:uncharacterized protein LOC130800981 n=1 Tax=Amaranthus tricolor TaxID=29722 RepID=UPI00258DC30B|nr:uncharacterized protein LOC130800981 [Amaranthus tricolor]
MLHASRLPDDIRANNGIPSKALNELLWSGYGVEMAQPDFALPSNRDVIKSTNEGSHANCAWYPPAHPDRPLVFMSIFISFKASLDGLFAGCKSLIGVDEAHLKGNYGGVLLSAIALNGTNEMFPVAWGIVSCEDEESWKQKGIDKTLNDLWPKVQRRYSCGAFSTFTFAKTMNEIEKNNPEARKWLVNLGSQERWTKHKFDPELKCDINKTNFVESFNATLGTDRCKPVLTMLEGIRRVTMVRLAAKRQKCEDWERLCPNIVKRAQVLCNESRSCRTFMSSPGEYKVVEGKSTLSVSLNQHTCLCNVW